MPHLAVIADVHGNAPALDAVAEDLATRHVDVVLNLGDCVYGPLYPDEAADRLIELSSLTVRGNQDRVVTDDTAPPSDTLTFARDALRPAHRRWLEELSPTAVFGRVLLCHGTPADDEEPLLEHVTASGVHLRAADAIRTLLPPEAPEVILCAHTHVPRAVTVGERLVVNPGSVGLPAYTAEAPFPHAMEAGSPHARYALLTASEAGWTVEHVAVPYDWKRAAARARELGRPDWAQWISTGRASDEA